MEIKCKLTWDFVRKILDTMKLWRDMLRQRLKRLRLKTLSNYDVYNVERKQMLSIKSMSLCVQNARRHFPRNGKLLTMKQEKFQFSVARRVQIRMSYRKRQLRKLGREYLSLIRADVLAVILSSWRKEHREIACAQSARNMMHKQYVRFVESSFNENIKKRHVLLHVQRY